MTLEQKTPKARKEARNYCRRCLAVMLCCVLAFGLTVRTAPRAKAIGIVDGTSAVEIVGGPNLTVIEGGAVAGGAATKVNVTGSSFGAFLLAACGINILVDSIDYSTTRYSGGTVYEEGNELWAYLYDLGGNIADWCMGTETSAEEKGGIRPGESFTVPAEVAEAVRQWAGTHFDFTSGICTYDQAAICTTEGNCFVLSEVDTSGISNWYDGKGRILSAPLARLGTPLRQTALTSWAQPYVGTYENSYSVGRLTFTQKVLVENMDSSHVSGSYSFRSNFLSGELCDAGTGKLINGVDMTSYSSGDVILSDMVDYFQNDKRVYFLFYSRANNRIYSANCDPARGVCQFYGDGYLDLSKYSDLVQGFSTTLTKTPELDEPKTEDLTITIPPELPTTQVGELTIPVITEITSPDLTEAGGQDNPSVDPTPSTGLTPGQITGAVTEALPDSGSVLGDQTIEETMDNSDDLQTAFISKFPFCIPWDVVQAIELLAAPPVTPRWEIDLYGPLQGKWGFHAETTSIVIDLTPLEPAAVVTRWVSTIMFIYGLASATKRYIWTA